MYRNRRSTVGRIDARRRKQWSFFCITSSAKASVSHVFLCYYGDFLFVFKSSAVLFLCLGNQALTSSGWVLGMATMQGLLQKIWHWIRRLEEFSLAFLRSVSHSFSLPLPPYISPRSLLSSILSSLSSILTHFAMIKTNQQEKWKRKHHKQSDEQKTTLIDVHWNM